MHLWGVPGRHVGTAVLRMARDRARLRAVPGLRFAKLLGTGDGETFTVRDVTPRRWGLLATWASAQDAAGFDDSAVSRSWSRISTERWWAELRPLASRGRWSGRQPFGDPRPVRHDGPVAALTRARIAPRKAVTFWRAVPPVSADLHEVDGLRLAIGVGEAPVGLQGTFSVWDSAAALREFAHRRPAHQVAVRRTTEERWYAEELFARFAVVAAHGTVDGREPVALTGPTPQGR